MVGKISYIMYQLIQLADYQKSVSNEDTSTNGLEVALHKAPAFSKCISCEKNTNLPFIIHNNQINRSLILSKTPSETNGVILKLSTKSSKPRIKSTPTAIGFISLTTVNVNLDDTQIKQGQTHGKHIMWTKSTKKLFLCLITIFRAQVKHLLTLRERQIAGMASIPLLRMAGLKMNSNEFWAHVTSGIFHRFSKATDSPRAQLLRQANKCLSLGMCDETVK